MSILSRLFGKGARTLEPAPAPPAASAAPQQPVEAIRPAPAPEPAADHVEAAPGPAPELKSLNRYKQDPAFQNFMRMAKQPPGARRLPGVPRDSNPPGRGPGA